MHVMTWDMLTCKKKITGRHLVTLNRSPEKLLHLSSVEQDAYLRSADAYFMNRNYRQAQEMYDVVITIIFHLLIMPCIKKQLYQEQRIQSAEKINQLQSLEQKLSNFIINTRCQS